MAQSADVRMEESPDRIRRDISRIRFNMGETLSMIRDKLSKGHIKSEARRRVYMKTVNPAMRTVFTTMDVIRRRKGLASVTALGMLLMGWRYYRNRRYRW